ncbi:hypothetical protein TOI97_10795 [Denitrificimonas sp. JX-1]|uniref:Uncharacterized protein n=1 Tax=Denitrificimonas halotolerans TaxID=3098930 RepID=A0ABU5GT49_9GAMM|nr:hypothetical protein [Denitrificimonas sp. JX-1]MDY7220049.1 hypothetical protein [Denitrificimonas sp. JX-1]
MTWHLFAVFIIGLCLGGIAFFLRKVSRDRLPKWIIPISAGIGMFSYLAYYDYTWFEFKQSQLPPGSIVVERAHHSNFFKPWGYIVPSVTSFVVLDGQVRTTQINSETLVEYVRYEFINDYRERLETQPYVLNCSTAEQLPVLDKQQKQTIKVEQVSRDSLLFTQLCHTH